MEKTLHIGSLFCDFYPHNGAASVTYILTPMPLDMNMVNQCAAIAKTNVVVISGMDWDNDLTPWPAPGVPKGCPPFKGLAPQLLKTLESSVLPKCEANLGLATKPVRNLVGISLSGLFAVWTWVQGGPFRNVCSISGSLWYQGFVEWLQKTNPTPVKGGRIYFSLGEEEPHSHNKIFATVGECTAQVVERLFSLGYPVEFQSNPGSHYAPIAPRLIRAFDFLSQS